MKGDNVKAQRAIVIVRASLSTHAQRYLATLRADDCFMEYFEESELLVNITRHKLVPKHRVLTPVEKQALLDR